jgi:hypothetical protein
VLTSAHKQKGKEHQRTDCSKAVRSSFLAPFALGCSARRRRYGVPEKFTFWGKETDRGVYLILRGSTAAGNAAMRQERLKQAGFACLDLNAVHKVLCCQVVGLTKVHAKCKPDDLAATGVQKTTAASVPNFQARCGLTTKNKREEQVEDCPQVFSQPTGRRPGVWYARRASQTETRRPEAPESRNEKA